MATALFLALLIVPGVSALWESVPEENGLIGDDVLRRAESVASFPMTDPEWNGLKGNDFLRRAESVASLPMTDSEWNDLKGDDFLRRAESVASLPMTDPKWNDLKVTWGNPSSNSPNYFQSQPRTANDAIKSGFVKISDCDTNANWRGARYVKDDDYSLILLYDVNGYIAGIQTAVNKSVADYPSSKIRPPFVSDGDRWVLSAYFVDPEIICSIGRTDEQFKNDGTGDRVLIQNSEDFSEMIEIPMDEKNVGSDWGNGRCYYTMGQHYWYNTSDDMSCDDFFPVFILYNNNELNAIGWAMNTILPSTYLEYHEISFFESFMESIPKCLRDSGIITTLHIFLTSDPKSNFC